jgi:hypothetical protein
MLQDPAEMAVTVEGELYASILIFYCCSRIFVCVTNQYNTMESCLIHINIVSIMICAYKCVSCFLSYLCNHDFSCSPHNF